MRFLLGLLVLTACGIGEKRSIDRSEPESTLVVAKIPTRSWDQQQRLPEGDTKRADTNSSLIPVTPVHVSASPEGDSVTEIGGAKMPDPYWVHEYLMNGVRYAAIEQEIGKKANGQPLMGEVSRVTLPAMDSTEHLMFAGLCGIDDKSDAYVLAIVGLGEDTANRVYRNIRKAWRFQRASRSFVELPTKNVVCFDPGED